MKEHYIYFHCFNGKWYYSTIYASSPKEAKELFLERIPLSLLLNIRIVTVYEYKNSKKATLYNL